METSGGDERNDNGYVEMIIFGFIRRPSAVNLRRKEQKHRGLKNGGI